MVLNLLGIRIFPLSPTREIYEKYFIFHLLCVRGFTTNLNGCAMNKGTNEYLFVINNVNICNK